jgi:hypothetical protein
VTSLDLAAFAGSSLSRASLLSRVSDRRFTRHLRRGRVVEGRRVNATPREFGFRGCPYVARASTRHHFRCDALVRALHERERNSHGRSRMPSRIPAIRTRTAVNSNRRQANSRACAGSRSLSQPPVDRREALGRARPDSGWLERQRGAAATGVLGGRTWERAGAVPPAPEPLVLSHPDCLSTGRE